MLWPNNKNPPDLIFTDRNFEAQTPPTVFCDYRYLPFRDGVFQTVFYDPPHAARNKISREYQHQNPAAWSYYGWDITATELKEGIRGASKEFRRVAKRVCLKWSEVDWGESWILAMMREWRPLLKHIIKYSKIEHIASYWITMVPKDEDEERRLYSPNNGTVEWGLLRPVTMSPRIWGYNVGGDRECIEGDEKNIDNTVDNTAKLRRSRKKKDGRTQLRLG